MIQHEDQIDRKLIALAGTFKTAIVRLLQKNIDENYFTELYQPIVKHMLDYYKTYFSLLTADTLTQILVDKNQEDNSIQAIITTFDDILGDTDLVKDESSMTELDFFVDRIKQRKALNILKETSKKLAKDVIYSRIGGGKDTMMKAISEIEKVTSHGDIVEGSLAELAQPRIDRYDEKQKHPERFRGIQSGFPALDKTTYGFQPGELVLYVAEPAGGKSANMLHSAFHAWKEKFPGAKVGANVVLFTIEMDWEQYLRRFDSMHASLDSMKLKSASLTKVEYAAWMSCIEYQKTKPNLFYLVDMPSGCTTLYIRNKLDEIRMKYPDNPIDLIVIDYLGIMAPSHNTNEGDWYRQGIISQECKELARQERAVVLTAVQETRESAKGTGKVPKNSTILGRSQMIPANANIIIYLKPLLLEEVDDEFEVFKTYNEDPNILDYATIKSRDGSKPSWRCGTNFSKMLIQPLHVSTENPEDTDNSLGGMVVNTTNSSPSTTKQLDPEDEAELEGYYEQIRPNTVTRHQFSSI